LAIALERHRSDRLWLLHRQPHGLPSGPCLGRGSVCFRVDFYMRQRIPFGVDFQ
jgi:hypothetical protein